jgi:hypothetical protein
VGEEGDYIREGRGRKQKERGIRGNCEH